MKKALDLARRLRAATGVPLSVDILRDYRLWLDEKAIPAETDRGWPTMEAYSQENVDLFAEDYGDFCE